MQSIELFAGAGGLAMGMAAAGFEHLAVVEWNKQACETFRRNQARHVRCVENWPLFQGDVRAFDFRPYEGKADVVSGGPPCQPFSLAGKGLAHDDERDMFSEAARAIREVRPKAFLLENVRGLTRASFENYYHYILLSLSYPSLKRRGNEEWAGHRKRLERHHTSGQVVPEYRVLDRIVNAADFGVPQKRERVFIVGVRNDVDLCWSFPDSTHSEDALLREQWVTGSYWDRHGIASKDRPTLSPRLAKRVSSLGDDDLFTKGMRPWRTVRDAIVDLPDLNGSAEALTSNHILVPGARAYIGHTGSPLDEPAKTLKAGDHGVPGGENMLLAHDGSVRYFSVREAARLQTFPDDYEFSGAWTQCMRQLGNAVPVQLAQSVASRLREGLSAI